MKPGQKLTEEQATAVNLGDCYRRLNYHAARIVRAQTRGRTPSQVDVAAVRELKTQIAALKTGRDARQSHGDASPEAGAAPGQVTT